MSIPTVGLLYPGHSAQDDFGALAHRLAGVVRLPLVHTSVGEDAHRVDALLDLGSPARLAAGARALADHAPDAVLWACTSGSFVFGPDGAQRQVTRLAELFGRPASSTSIGFVNAAAALGLRRVAVAASYPRDVAECFVAFLAAGGIEVLAMDAGGIVTAAEVGRLAPDRVVAMAAAVDTADAEAVLVPDTALHTLALLPELEAALGKPVLTANQVTVWEGLRLIGEVPELPGLGTLFAGAGSGRP